MKPTRCRRLSASTLFAAMENGDVPEDANEHCPGNLSESAGKADCEGCPNQQACATAPKGPDPGPLSVPLPLIASGLFIL
ncbi:hypothetical protein BT93_L5651 [Corymbia citriodora subsp. variegata]|uniref:Uncharacterized protein n=1 Tax=Corymbia citriodora subsp. variegata TaxID=360336 RepID=A0A8T0CRK6_CORYI|nr:hypothetical protein BT93_L5651 [Corymbia citriodora subsp. variegata]